MAASFLSSAWVNAPAAKPHMSADGHFDIELVFAENESVTATDDLPSAVANGFDVEGGSSAELFVRLGAVTGTTPTLDLALEVSLDNGSTWNYLEILPQLTDAEAGIEVARKVYIPLATDANGVNLRPLVRLEATVGGSTPDFTVTAYLRPISAGTDKAIEELI